MNPVFMKYAFERYDRNKDGILSRGEVKNMLYSLHVPAQDTDVKALFETMDENYDGGIEYAEFLQLMPQSVREKIEKFAIASTTFPEKKKRNKLALMVYAFQKGNLHSSGVFRQSDLKDLISGLKLSGESDAVANLFKLIDKEQEPVHFEQWLDRLPTHMYHLLEDSPVLQAADQDE